MLLIRIIVRLLVFFFNALVLYFLIVIIGLFWARNRQEVPNPIGIPLVIHGDGFHTELYLPIEDSIIHHNWLDFLQDTTLDKKHRGNKLFNIGWGEEDWFLAGVTNKTTIPLGIEALIWPWNKGAMHVQLMDSLHSLRQPFTARRFLSADEYLELIDFIRQGFLLKNNKPVIRSYQGFYGYDYFFSSTRKYNAFNTCNQWTADALNSCGIRNPAFASFGWSIAYQVGK